MLCMLILYNGGSYSLKSTSKDRFFEKVFMAILFSSWQYVLLNDNEHTDAYQILPLKRLNIYTDCSKLNNKVGSEIYSGKIGLNIPLRLPNYCSVFQAKLISIFSIFFDSQAAIRTLSGVTINSESLGSVWALHGLTCLGIWAWIHARNSKNSTDGAHRADVNMPELMKSSCYYISQPKWINAVNFNTRKT